MVARRRYRWWTDWFTWYLVAVVVTGNLGVLWSHGML